MMFVPEQAEDEGRLVEDGFGMLLTDASWAAVHSAIRAGESLSIPATKAGFGFSLEWIETGYHNPVDGLVYGDDEGWELYCPRSSGADSPGALEVEQIVLLTGEQDLWGRVGTVAFVDYARAIEAAARHHFDSMSASTGQDLAAQFEVWQNGDVDLRVVARPGIANEILRRLHESLLALPAPSVSHASIKFLIVFRVWGGAATGHRER